MADSATDEKDDKDVLYALGFVCGHFAETRVG
jgi:hypothetical protein